MSFNQAAQEIIYGLLNGNLTGCTVYDTVPFLPEAAPDNSFPYCVIGEDLSSAWDTDDTLGARVTVTIHFWSRAKEMKPVKDLMDEAYTALHRATPTKSGYNVVDCLVEFSRAMNDPDGATKHGVMQIALTLQET